MTTIVFTKEQVAADSQITEAHGRVCNNTYTKITENDKYIIGMAGAIGQCQRVVDWMLEGCCDEDGNPTIPYIPDREEVYYQIAYIEKDTGKIFTIEGICFDIIEVNYPYAIGSGSDFALGFLHKRRGKDLAIKAVKAAYKYDVNTNDTVSYIDVVLNTDTKE